ncbi:MAG: DUF2782 domain-containing protein [Gammaproteobacteria bacterium]|nr:DUF2782 domain-containing protein [Gammaproteobacteria bacterium]MXY54013.1 DUF2782 domain-containing protein [Gammaproteobacteria bacterium]
MALRLTLPHAPAVARALLATGVLSLAALAATTASARPAEDPPPLHGPDVTLIETEERTIQEFRQNGVLVFVKITPKNGKPYYLAPRDPTKGWDDLERAEAVVPRWVILRF